MFYSSGRSTLHALLGAQRAVVAVPGKLAHDNPRSGLSASQRAGAAGIACGAMAIAAKDNAESPFRICGPGSNLADHRLEVTAGGELILAGGMIPEAGRREWHSLARVSARACSTVSHVPNWTPV